MISHISINDTIRERRAGGRSGVRESVINDEPYSLFCQDDDSPTSLRSRS